MEYSEIVFRSMMIEKENARLGRERMEAAAFTAWLQGAGGEGVGFGDFLQSLGLSERKKQMPTGSKKQMIERANKIEERLRQLEARRKK